MMTDSKGRRPSFRRRTAPGAPPGTLETDPHAPFPAISVIGFGPERVVEKTVQDVRELELLVEGTPVTWINVDGLGDAPTLIELAEMFGIHRLALEDVVHPHQRAKVEEYGEELFIVARMISRENEVLSTEQISLFLGEGFVVTFQEHPGDCLEPVRERIRKGRGRIRQAGSDYLAYAILDAVVDAYFPILEELGEELEELEEEILEIPDRGTVSRIHTLKRDLLLLRRTVWPLREAVNALLREESILMSRETQIYLRDCYDHTIQVIDMVENHRDITSGLMDFYLSSVSNRMNEVMKVLTIIATIFIPLTFIAGIYGMNFNPEASPWNMPELNWRWGYPVFWVLMVTIGGTLLYVFRRKGWLGGGGKGDAKGR
ncbi:MAG: magnesium/cobalt transporter CorA [bacterium]|nr:MAG: magnesium/cobalt transporter CorA [bacterium]